MAENIGIDQFETENKVYSSEDESQEDVVPDADDLLETDQLNSYTEFAKKATRILQLEQNATVVRFDANNKAHVLTDSEKSELLNIPTNVSFVSQILEPVQASVRPVPDTIQNGTLSIVTPSLSLDKTVETLKVSRQEIVSSLGEDPKVIQNNENGVDGSSILSTNSSSIIGIGAYGRQRIAEVKPVNPKYEKVGKPKITKSNLKCSDVTVKGTPCTRNATAGCKYCTQHYKKRLENGEISEEETEEEPIYTVQKISEIKGETKQEIKKENNLTKLINETIKENYPEYKFSVGTLYKLSNDLYTQISEINSISELNNFLIMKLTPDFYQSIIKKENSDLQKLKDYTIQYLVANILDIAVDSTENDKVSSEDIIDAISQDDDLSEIFNIEEFSAEKQLDELDEIVDDYDKDAQFDDEVKEIDENFDDTKDDENTITKRKYKLKLKTVPKSIKVEKTQNRNNKIILKESKIIPVDPRWNTNIKNSIQGVVEKMSTETMEIFKFRENYTLKAFELSAGGISWDSCIVLGKIKVNKIMFGSKYDSEMENLVMQIDQNM